MTSLRQHGGGHVLQRSRRLGRMDRGAPRPPSGPPQPTLANFGSATFTSMAATASGAVDLDRLIDMVDESGNTHRDGRRDRERLLHRSRMCRARAAIGWSVPTAGSSPSVRPSSTDRPGACTCNGPWSASCRRQTTAGTGSTPPTAESSATGTPSSTARSLASGSIQRVGTAQQPQRAHCRHGAVHRRRRLLHGGLRRRGLRFR